MNTRWPPHGGVVPPHASSQRNSATAITETTTAKASRMPICGSTAAGPCPRTMTASMPSTRWRISMSCEIVCNHPGAPSAGKRAGRERHRQHDQVSHHAGRLGLAERPGEQADRQNASVPTMIKGMLIHQ